MTGSVGPSNAGQPLVLIVDDNERNLRLARDVLRAAGLRTLEGATGAEGIALAEQHLPDLILMDLGLPDMDGTAAARKLGEAERTARIPVVALTSRRLEGGAWYLDAGFAGYLEKPFDVLEFPDQVRGFCARPGR
ncbi:MAG: response regulator [Actinobacteria bacterium]|nr:response regulator [Actinomycetota bacterium]